MKAKNTSPAAPSTPVNEPLSRSWSPTDGTPTTITATSDPISTSASEITSHAARSMPRYDTTAITKSSATAVNRSSTATNSLRYRPKPSDTVAAATTRAAVIDHPTITATHRGNTWLANSCSDPAFGNIEASSM